jgi:hypothetical protein
MLSNTAIPAIGESEMSTADLLKRYHDARLVCYRTKMGDERQAMLAAQYALADMTGEFSRNSRLFTESYALEVLAIEVEDIEKAAAAHQQKVI